MIMTAEQEKSVNQALDKVKKAKQDLLECAIKISGLAASTDETADSVKSLPNKLMWRDCNQN